MTSGYLTIFKNSGGSSFENIGYLSSAYPTVNSASTIELNAGDYIDFRCSGSYPALGGATRSGATCWVHIERVGN